MKEVREAVVEIAERVTVAELCNRWRKLNAAPQALVDYEI